MARENANDENPDVAAPLDQLLTQAATGPLRQFLPGMSGVRLAVAMARRPKRVAARAGSLGGELARIVVGASDVAPSGRDRRFSDPAWTGNPVLRRLVQAYLATGEAAEGLVQDLPMPWADARKMQFITENAVAALSPSNNPLISPVAWKSFIDTGGKNAVSGPLNLVTDLATAPRVPTMVDARAYAVGTDLGITPGEVVFRSPVLEIIQYRPQTEQVHAVPLLVVPPTINKYYLLDLAPGRSVMEYLVQQGQQVFVASWRNPDSRHSKWGFDTYVTAILEAISAVEEITGASKVNILAACSGGLLSAITAAHMAQKGTLDGLGSLSLLVTMIDQERAGTIGALVDPGVAARATAQSRRKGYLDGRALAEVFAWLRPNDLIWNYWVNNYVQGKRPPKFDILYWNADTTRMSARLHSDFVDMALHNRLMKPGSSTVLDTEIDLEQITVDSYVVAGSADHICPWENCYTSARALGGTVRFVLSTSGHIAALVNPPTNPKASFQVSADVSLPPEEWRRETPIEKGSWWPDYAAWLAERAGDLQDAPNDLGSERNQPIEAAPGSYVLDR